MEKGTLYVVATPIGNLGDITFRAVETLKNADMIAAEDTRQTLKLLSALDIKNKLISFHKYSSQGKLNEIISFLLDGKNIALVSDAGTPIVSDPGDSLVSQAVHNGIKVVPIPGACAAISALTVSALPSDKFIFEGFLPKDKTRKTVLDKLCENEYTSIVYESPHQLLRTFEELCERMPERNCAVCREMTKMYEQVIRCTISEALKYFSENTPKGEFVIVIEGKAKEKEEISDEDIVKYIKELVDEGATKKQAATMAAKALGINKNRAYKLSIG